MHELTVTQRALELMTYTGKFDLNYEIMVLYGKLLPTSEKMDLMYQKDSTLALASLLFLITLIPTKITVRFIGADYGSIARCAVVVLIATVTVLFSLQAIKSFASMAFVFIWLMFVFNRTLGLSKSWSGIFTVWMGLIQLAALQGLQQFGFYW
ncbi:hypothetical protein J8M20_23480 [Pseudoalteromonas luteoviolacea]|uniref:hypothetical protein n=1 Tax=Pseudoalteromonas luteoviolacea TaxID=43657 RepID=UPI001B3743A9|nr:hypothetical protein [Pseudoalteromonas luteoviolacea]MBQ4814346.1 hypothetical protein [Pseudoalteromonas luteoviolacea]